MKHTKSATVLLVGLGLLNGTLLEVGPVNTQNIYIIYIYQHSFFYYVRYLYI